MSHSGQSGARERSPRAPVVTERRPVAVIDLSEDDQVKGLSNQIYRALQLHDRLRAPDQRDFDQWLTGPLVDEDAVHITAARDRRIAAETARNQLDSTKAAAVARDGQHELALVVPTFAVMMLYTELTLELGLAELDQGKLDAANKAFVLVQRLDPARTLDPVRYTQEVVAAYERARATKPAMVELAIKGSGRVWIDGVERGPAPGSFDVETGDHLVTLTGTDRETRGKPITITAAATLEIDDAPATADLQVRRARLVLSRTQAAGDDAGRAGAMKQLAALLGVADAVMISKRPDGKLQWETWQDRAPGFSAPQEYTHQEPLELLEPLAPPKPPEPPQRVVKAEPFHAQPIVVEEAWYRRRWVQASAVTGAIAVIVGAIVYARRAQFVGVDMDVKGM